MMYKVEVKNKGGSEVYVKSASGQFTVDLDGKTAVTSLDALLGSLGACMSYFIRKFAKSANIQMDMFKLDLEADLVSDNGYKFKKINVAIDTDGAVLDDAKKQSLAQFVKNCPTHNTLRSGPEIDIRIL